jgi:hypothetical protein
MPATLNSLVHILRLMFRARWEILEPCFTEAAYNRPPPSKERCGEMVQFVLCEYKVLNRDLANLNLGTPTTFHAVFDEEFWPEIDALSAEWVALADDLTANPPANAEELSSSLTALRRNNAKWMNIGAKQFAKEVEHLGKLV